MKEQNTARIIREYGQGDLGCSRGRIYRRSGSPRRSSVHFADDPCHGRSGSRCRGRQGYLHFRRHDSFRNRNAGLLRNRCSVGKHGSGKVHTLHASFYEGTGISRQKYERMEGSLRSGRGFRSFSIFRFRREKGSRRFAL